MNTYGVIPPVEAEASRGATPERAVQAFWVNIGFTLLSAITLVFIAIRSKGRSWISTSGLIIVGLIVLLLGLALADAASAYQKHGQLMESASVILFICAAIWSVYALKTLLSICRFIIIYYFSFPKK